MCYFWVFVCQDFVKVSFRNQTNSLILLINLVDICSFLIYNYRIMKSTIKMKTWKAIYRLLGRVSPVDYDCGKLCAAACCTCTDESSDEELGIYLYPGEDKIHDKNDSWLDWTTENAEDFEFPDSWSGKVHFVKCKTPPICPRNKRPFQCRTFPLAPHLHEDGTLELIYNDVELPYTCPLIDDEIPLNDDFVKATYTVWSHLIRDPLIRDLVEMDSRARDEELYDL